MSWRLRRAAPFLLVALGLLLAYRLTAPPGLTWKHGGVDGGELALVSARLGIAHPPGYALYTGVNALILGLPLGVTPILKMQLFAHVIALLTCALLGYAAWRLATDLALPQPYLAGVVAASALGLSRTFWSQAIVVEVYGLNALFFAAGLAFAVRWRTRRPTTLGLIAAGHLLGLAVTHHLTALLWLPGFLVLTNRLRWRDRALLVSGMLSGVVWVWLWMFVRAGRDPLADWGGISRGWDAFWALITARQYGAYVASPASAGAGNSLLHWLGSLPGEFGLVLCVLLVVGVVTLARRLPALLIASLLWIACLLVFLGVYDARETFSVYALPLSLVLAIWISLGASRLLERGASRRQAGGVLVVTLIVGLLLLNNGAAVDIHTDREAELFAEQAFAALPPDALVLTADDYETFTLWYYRYVEGQGVGLIIVDAPLLQHDWYRASLARLYPELGGAGESALDWLRSAGRSDRPIAATSFVPPAPGRQVRRSGDWYVSLPASTP